MTSGPGSSVAGYYHNYCCCLSIFDVLYIIQAPSYKTFSMLNLAEHEISDAQKYKNIKKFSFYQVQISLECFFFLAHKC